MLNAVHYRSIRIAVKRSQEANFRVNSGWHRTGKTNNLGQMQYYCQDNDQKGALQDDGTDWEKFVHRKKTTNET